MGDPSPEKHPMNLNSTEFSPEAYVNGLVHRKGLDELVAIEEDMVQSVRRLDSEMQQLVYENYSKFLSATNTVRSMQDQFSQMCDNLTKVSKKMDNVLHLNDSLCDIFVRHRANVKKLNDASKTVKGLQFIVKLPQRLQVFIDQKEFKKAVTNYCSVKHKLIQYKNVPSMVGIYNDTLELISQIEEKLQAKLSSRLISADELVEAVQLLQELGVPHQDLEEKMVNIWREQIQTDLDCLKGNSFSDILEFAENGCCSFLTTLSIAVNLYPQLFAHADNRAFVQLIDKFLGEFESTVHSRFSSSTDSRDSAIYVRALDRVYRKMSACSRLITWRDCSVMENSIVVNAADNQIDNGRRNIISLVKTAFGEILSEKQETLSISGDVSQMIHKLEQTYLVAVKTTLANLLLFTASDITFSAIDQACFFNSFSLNVFQKIIVGSVNNLAEFGKEIISQSAEKSGPSGQGYLAYAQFLNTTQKKHISYLIDLCQEQFKLINRTSELTPPAAVIDRLESIAKVVLKGYSDFAASEMSRLCDNYIKAYDWQKNEIPKTIAKEIKTVLKHVKGVSVTTSVFLSDSPRKERSPELCRNITPRHGPSSNFDTGSISSALERMWADRIESSTVVEFKQESIMLAVTKIGLRSLIESTRLRVFSCCGLQQIQVDCLYLKHKLWDYVPDEHVLNCLYDDLVSSAINQCNDPRLLDPATAKKICEDNDK
ncbi:hypothetical protein FO519_000536 [Halicephalobus sp. NKZ332]|nr:hypothetical protein FO519_000536 [Halicephalobus sp. NKZ332]